MGTLGGGKRGQRGGGVGTVMLQRRFDLATPLWLIWPIPFGVGVYNFQMGLISP